MVDFDGILAIPFLMGLILACGSLPGDSDPLAVNIHRLILDSGAESVSVAYYDLHSRRELLLRPDTKYHPASTMKVAVMFEVYRQAREGQFRLDDPIPIRNEFTSIADGSRFSIDRDSDG